MKYLAILLLCVCFSSFAADQKKTISSTLTHVTVFLEGAQINRKSSTSLARGKTILTLKNLSPFIDRNSIRVKGEGAFMVLSVNHRINYIKDASTPADTSELNNQVEKLSTQLAAEESQLTVLQKKVGFMSANEHVISSQAVTSPADFKLMKQTFYTEYEQLQKLILNKQKEIRAIVSKVKALDKQIKTLATEKGTPNSEITITVLAQGNTQASFTIDYYVAGAGWFPSYDLRTENINTPVKLFYKANIYQNTKVDWKNVTLTLSNASPSESADLPILQPYYLAFSNYRNQFLNPSYQSNARYNPSVRKVTGTVKDEHGETVPFAAVMVAGTTIGVSTDFDGQFSLSIPEGAKEIQVSFVGYVTKRAVISSSRMYIVLEEETATLDEVVISEGKNKKRTTSSLWHKQRRI